MTEIEALVKVITQQVQKIQALEAENKLLRSKLEPREQNIVGL